MGPLESQGHLPARVGPDQPQSLLLAFYKPAAPHGWPWRKPLHLGWVGGGVSPGLWGKSSVPGLRRG